MDSLLLKELFYKAIPEPYPEDWQVEDIISPLRSLSIPSCQQLLHYVPAIWPISSSLCCSYLEHGMQLIKNIPRKYMGEWIRSLLTCYETGGLKKANSFFADLDQYVAAVEHDVSSATLEEYQAQLTAYLHGISGEDLSIRADTIPWTDTSTIYLPLSIDLYGSKRENFLFYKFIVSYQWSLIALGVFKSNDDSILSLQEELEQYPNHELAYDLTRIIFFVFGVTFLQTELPGLWRRTESLLASQIDQAESAGQGEGKTHLVSLLQSIFPHKNKNMKGASLLPKQLRPLSCAILSESIRSLYDDVENCSGTFDLSALSLLLGKVDFSLATKEIEKKRESRKNKFIKNLAHILADNIPDTNSPSLDVASNKDQQTDMALLIEGMAKAKIGKKEIIHLQNGPIQIPETVLAQVRNISKELGELPVGYVQAAFGLAGGGRLADGGKDSPVNDDSPDYVKSGFVYDEWDFRRVGYRQNWCTVQIENINLVKNSFIENTLHKHRRLIAHLRRQFEMLRTSHRYVRRRRDGDEIDLDAMVDALGDFRAGISPSDRLFIRLLKEQRDIATYILVDMSNSTEGWVGTLIKESLVLLCEALEEVGDRYAIVGFSGMRRSRCKLYRVKDIDEPYADAVRNKIGSIGPMEYTRMAPAIRHITGEFQKIDAKVRLLVILSDGKPEDYDGYNGAYAIEDSRKALLEAKGAGLMPFFITIDKEAHGYLEHMCGRGNYTYINRLESLPLRMSTIYRTLTS